MVKKIKLPPNYKDLEKNEDNFKILAALCENRNEMHKNMQKFFYWGQENGLLDKYLPSKRRKLTDELAKKTALLCKNRSEFQAKDESLYKYAARKGILDLVCSHMS